MRRVVNDLGQKGGRRHLCPRWRVAIVAIAQSSALAVRSALQAVELPIDSLQRAHHAVAALLPLEVAQGAIAGNVVVKRRGPTTTLVLPLAARVS